MHLYISFWLSHDRKSTRKRGGWGEGGSSLLLLFYRLIAGGCVLTKESLHQQYISEVKKLATGLIERPKTVTTCIRGKHGGKEEERGRPNHFPCWLHRREGVKDHSSTGTLQPSSSPPSAPPGLLKRGPGWLLPSLCPLGFWRSDGWLHKETRSISHSQNLFKWLFHFLSVALRRLSVAPWCQR